MVSEVRTLGQRIKAQRDALKLSAREVARRAGISPSQWANLEQNKHVPSLRNQPGICAALRWRSNAIDEILWDIAHPEHLRETNDWEVPKQPEDIDAAIAWTRDRLRAATDRYAEFGDPSSLRDKDFFTSELENLVDYEATLEPRASSGKRQADDRISRRLDDIEARLAALERRL
jgi:transcriptional regulator with XRE-family HTH domain